MREAGNYENLKQRNQRVGLVIFFVFMANVFFVCFVCSGLPGVIE